MWRGTDDRGMGEKMRDEWMTSDEARDDVLKRRRDMRDAFGRLEGRRDGAWRVIDRLRRGRAFAWSGGRLRAAVSEFVKLSGEGELRGDTVRIDQ